MNRNGFDRFRLGLLAALLVAAGSASGYEGSLHQRLTFLAAKQFNRCVEDTGISRLTPLQVRYMARSNVGVAESNVFSRLFRWRYYDRSDESERSFLGVVDTRFHEHFNELLRRLEDADDQVQAYQELGRIISYLQIVSSPAHVVPVYTTRFWRFSLKDRFDGYPVDEASIERALGEDCGFLQQRVDNYTEILTGSANETLRAVVQPITGMPATWEAFWKLGDDARSFGEYGPAGNNFGRRTQFRCDAQQRCLLLDDDPLYAEFALARHLQAVRGTLSAMRLIQISNAHDLAGTR
jgi:hypothetical protein